MTADLSVATLRSLVGVESDAGDEELLAAARRGNNKLAAILLSIWQRERSLPPAQRRELNAHQERARRYDEALGVVSAAAEVYSIKGKRIADLYPKGIVRQFRDLDLVAPSIDNIWRAADTLCSVGWTVEGFTLMPLDGELRPIFELERPIDGEEFPDAVHLSSVAFPGYLWGGVPPRATIPSEGRSAGRALDLLRIAVERLERRFAARDIVDALVVIEAAEPDDATDLWALLDDYLLWPEWRELNALVLESSSLPPAFALPKDAHTRSRAARVRRYQRQANMAAKPWRGLASYAQLRMLEGRKAALDRIVLPRVRARVTPLTALKYGLPVFGVPLERDAPSAELALERKNGAVVARTPVGAFALTAGDDVDLAGLSER